MASNTDRPRKRTKTFTGCWTCRARKIKCDEAKPSCQQCYNKGRKCEGYHARLQWLTPIKGEQGLNWEDPLLVSTSQSQRRLLPAGALIPSTSLD
jgi:arginine metabolism regulation protein II